MSVQGPNVAAMGATGGTQLSFADLAHAQGAAWTPADEMSLRETTFVVVDLETTGGRTTGNDATPPDAITEIGAVKVCGGAVLGEFATLVNPQHSIPPQIVRLTGITTAMVGNAPTIDAVLPMFFEFAGDSVLVAHNAGFDIGFLRAAARRCDITWPQPQVLCTMRLARRVLSRDEAPSVRLAALARLFAVASNPTHRALDDARATVDVLHALIERVGNQGVHTYAELRSYLPNVTQAQRCKRVLAETLPHRPGVYLFRGPSGEVLYVGTAADLRRRVSQYFNGTDRRKRMTEMVMLASSIDTRTPWRPVSVSCGCCRRMPRRITAGRSSHTGGGGWRSPMKHFHACRSSGPRDTTASSARSDPAPRPPRRQRCWHAARDCEPAPLG